MGQGTNEPPQGDTVFRVNSRANRQRASSSVGSAAGNGGGGGRDRSGTFAGEGHDHDEGFPASEREQMEECLEEICGHLGEFAREWGSSSSCAKY
jgi:phospholipase D1/2